MGLSIPSSFQFESHSSVSICLLNSVFKSWIIFVISISLMFLSLGITQEFILLEFLLLNFIELYFCVFFILSEFLMKFMIVLLTFVSWGLCRYFSLANISIVLVGLGGEI